MARAWSLLLALDSTSEAEGSWTSSGTNRQGKEGEWVILRRVKPGWGWWKYCERWEDEEGRRVEKAWMLDTDDRLMLAPLETDPIGTKRVVLFFSSAVSGPPLDGDFEGEETRKPVSWTWAGDEDPSKEGECDGLLLGTPGRFGTWGDVLPLACIVCSLDWDDAIGWLDSRPSSCSSNNNNNNNNQLNLQILNNTHKNNVN